ncbi:hypothetical protein JMJ77_0008744, partial [Colletotrichum scovillei]
FTSRLVNSVSVGESSSHKYIKSRQVLRGLVN